MGDASVRQESSTLKINKQCLPEREINILLLGQTGIGKTTFINSFANYLVHNTLDEALDDEIQVIISTSFSVVDPETFEQKLIKIEGKTNREKVTENGQSSTQQCQSYVFPIGDRNLRFIDTPGIGDTRGSEQDNRNLFEILTYISHYEHLNGICIFLKPNEERLTIAFRLCIRQVLHYLHNSASVNMIFIFTNSRSTFFMPGTSKKLLQVLLNQHHNENEIDVPFSKDNTFLLDNEAFHCLALHKNQIQINNEQMESYRKSWDHTLKEYERLLVYISKCPLHVVGSDLSLNGAEQLIRKLSRPIAETLRLIEQNIQLAKKYKENLLQKQGNVSHRLYQYTAEIVPLEHPRLVCINKKCLQIADVNKEEKIVSNPVCQEKSYLNGVIQETISDPRIAQTKVIDSETDKCTKCECSWKNHMNITYEYRTDLNHHGTSSCNNGNKDNQLLISFSDKRINDLQEEQRKIEDIYRKLSKFLYINAIHPFDDDIIEYFQLCIREEQTKHDAGGRNDDVIEGLQKLRINYEDDIDAFKKTLTSAKDSIIEPDVLKPENIFILVGTLYRLEINGQTIRNQIDVLKISEDTTVKRMENHIKLPAKAASSNIMTKLRDIIAPEINTRF